MVLALLVLLSLVLAGIGWLFFVYTVKSGQYEDPEGAKYRMLEDDESPPRSPTGGGSGAARNVAADPHAKAARSGDG